MKKVILSLSCLLSLSMLCGCQEIKATYVPTPVSGIVNPVPEVVVPEVTEPEVTPTPTPRPTVAPLEQGTVVSEFATKYNGQTITALSLNSVVRNYPDMIVLVERANGEILDIGVEYEKVGLAYNRVRVGGELNPANVKVELNDADDANYVNPETLFVGTILKDEVGLESGVIFRDVEIYAEEKAKEERVKYEAYDYTEVSGQDVWTASVQFSDLGFIVETADGTQLCVGLSIKYDDEGYPYLETNSRGKFVKHDYEFNITNKRSDDYIYARNNYSSELIINRDGEVIGIKFVDVP